MGQRWGTRDGDEDGPAQRDASLRGRDHISSALTQVVLRGPSAMEPSDYN